LRASFHRGDRAAIATLVRDFHADLARFASRFLAGDDERRDDAVQDAFLTALERHRLYDPARPLRPWLFAVCRNCCLGLRRRLAREGRGGESGARVVAIEEMRDAEGYDPPDPNALAAFEALARAEGDAEADSLLATLPEAGRVVVALRALDEFTFAEIAETLDEPIPTVANRYYRALEKLRREVERRRDAESLRTNEHGSRKGHA
jgi:RNA polymerase sigma-70 factor (ECF subfamily)